jgi:hypothetical protein
LTNYHHIEAKKGGKKLTFWILILSRNQQSVLSNPRTPAANQRAAYKFIVFTVRFCTLYKNIFFNRCQPIAQKTCRVNFSSATKGHENSCGEKRMKMFSYKI